MGIIRIPVGYPFCYETFSVDTLSANEHSMGKYAHEK